MNRIQNLRPHVVGALLVLCSVIAAAAVPVPGGEMRPADNHLMRQSGGATPAVVVGTAFTYQGRLVVSEVPANGPFDLQFRLMDSAAGGSQIGSTVIVDDAPVSEGLFTVELDFGVNAFGGGARWLEISVRPGAGGTYTLLSPRQKLNPSPSALTLPNVYSNEGIGFVGIGRSNQISTNEYFGLQAPSGANVYGGMYINTQDAAGWPFYGYATGGSFRAWTYYNGSTSEWHLYNGGERLFVPSGGGLEIANTTQTDGLRVNRTADDGAQLGNGSEYPNYGVYIPSPGTPNICLLIYTSAASGDYALYTTDNISAGNVSFTAQRVIARVDAGGALLPGDVVAGCGVDRPLEGGVDRLVLVQHANRSGSGVIGVVASRLEWQTAPGKEAEHEQILVPVDGPAEPGDYVALVTQGVTDVRVEPGASITKGSRLTASGAGGVRPLRVESLNGMPVSEGAPVVGVSLADGGGGDTVPVFVSIQ